MNVLVLGGGSSTERAVSLRSAAAVAEALVQAGYRVRQADPRDGPKIFNSLPADTIVFPILHGTGGEDGEIQEMLEEHQLPYLGSRVESSRTCFDKTKTRAAFQAAGLPVAEGDMVDEISYHHHHLTKKPHALKVNRGGSSIGTYLVSDPAKIDMQKVHEVFALDDQAVLEELVEGVEITVPVMDKKALPVIEIKPPVNEEFDYLNKYNGKTQEICPPISIDKQTQQQAQRYAVHAHQALGCRHLSRVDIIVKADNSMVLLEINTMPGMTNQSLYPLAAKAAGMTFPQLMDHFVNLVKRDYGIKE